LGYYDQWGEPSSLGRGIYSREAVRAEGKQLNHLPCVTRCWVVITREEEYVAQLFGTHPSDFDGQEYLKEIVMAQMEIIFMSGPMVCIRFFWKMGAHNFWFAGQWLYYGLYRMLVLTLGGVLLTARRPGHRLGVFQIVCRMMDLIHVEFTHSGSLSHMDNRCCPYHYDLCRYAGQAVHVLRVCRQQLGGGQIGKRW
jgi:hypothetical protein